MKRSDPQPACPCGMGIRYADCCGRWHAGAPAPTAAALMRSRYSAYVLELADYLLATWHADTRPPQVLFEPGTKWLGLTVKQARDSGPDSAQVEFVARFRVGSGAAVRLIERSSFIRIDGRWFYQGVAGA